MSRVDYEAAWDDLQALVLERDGWGTKQLIAEMAHLRVRHRIKEGLFERFLRLYGDRLTAIASHIREDESSAGGATTATARRDSHRATEDPEEDRDDRDDHHPRRSRVRAAA